MGFGHRFAPPSSSPTPTSVEKVINTSNFVAAAGGITTLDVVYAPLSGVAAKADASSEATGRVIGFAVTTAIGGASVQVQEVGIVSGFSGRTVNAPQFLSTNGTISESLPTADGSEIVLVGYAITASDIDIKIQKLGIVQA